MSIYAPLPGDPAAEMRSYLEATLGLESFENLMRANALVTDAPEREKVLAMMRGLSDEDLAAWALGIERLSVWGLNEPATEALDKLFARLATDVTDGNELARIVRAFTQASSTAVLDRFVSAVVAHTAERTKQQFIEATLRTEDFNFATDRSPYDLGRDREGQLVARVLKSLGPAALQMSIADMSEPQLAAVTAGSIEGYLLTLSDEPETEASPALAIADMKGLVDLIDASRACDSVRTRARVFAHAAHTFDLYHRGDPRLPLSTRLLTQVLPPDDTVQALTRLLDSDTRGIVHELFVDPPLPAGQPIADYLTQLYNAGLDGATPVVGRQIAQMNGAGYPMSAQAFLNETIQGPFGFPVHARAFDRVHYLSAISEAIGRLSLDEEVLDAQASNGLGTALLALHSVVGGRLGKLPHYGPVFRAALVLGATVLAAGAKWLGDDKNARLREAASQALYDAHLAACEGEVDYLDTDAGLVTGEVMLDVR